MNKVILGLILAVCVLGMALVMLNERLGRKPDEPASRPVATENRQEYKQPVSGIVEPVDRQNSLITPPTVAESSAPAVRPPVQPAPAPVPPQVAEAAREENAAARAALAAPEPPQPKPQPGQASQPEPAPAVENKKPEKAPEARKPQEETRKPTPQTVIKPAPVRDAPQGNTITRFVVFSRDKGATVRIGGNGKLGYKQMLLDNPDRMVIDLDGDWQFPANPGIPKNDLVSNVRVGKIGNNTRVVIDLKGKPRIARVLPGKGGDSLDVRLDR